MYKRTMVFGLSLLLFMVQTALYANTALPALHYKVTFNTHDIYDVNIGLKRIVWQGVKGVDQGKSDTITSFKRTNIANAVEVIAWDSKNTGAFNVIVVDHNQLKAVAIGKHGDETWLWHGTMVRLPLHVNAA